MKRARGVEATTKTKKSKDADSTSDKKGAGSSAKAPKEKKPKKDPKDRTPAEAAKAAAFHNRMKNMKKPTNLGGKKVPQGAPNCFASKVFVVTGVLESFERPDIKAIIEKYGGKLGGSITKSTTHVIVGENPGDTKINKAEELMLPQIDEDEFLDLIKQSNKDANDDEEADKAEEDEEDEEEEDEDDD